VEFDAMLMPVASQPRLDNVPSVAVTVGTGIDGGGDPTYRRTFGMSAALAGVGLSGAFAELFTSPDLPAQWRWRRCRR
jgi:hypothetical protein